MSPKTIAIMQPTFLPWIGYFAMVDAVDEFVFLDSVQFAARSWQQRNRIKTADGVRWVTVPVRGKGLRDQSIREVHIDEPARCLPRIARSISLSYAKAPHFDRYAPPMLSILESAPDLLAELTIGLIRHLMEVIGIRTPWVRSSELSVTGTKADLLAAICEARGAERYLSAPGSREYLEESSAMVERGIVVSYHAYEHPTYPQLWGPFVPYLAIVDLIFNVGPDSLNKIREGVPCASGRST